MDFDKRYPVNNFFTILLSVVCLSATAQHSLRFGALTDAGIPYHTFQKSRGVLGGKGFNFQSNWGLCLQYKAFNRIGLEVGITQNYTRWKIQDKEFERRNDGYKALTTNHNSYWGYYAGLYIYQPVSDETSFFLGGAMNWNSVGKYQNSITENFYIERDGSFISEDVTTSVSYLGNNTSYFGELGMEQKIGDRSTLSLGLKLNLGQALLSSGSYRVYDVINQKELVNDQFSSKGTFGGITVKYSFTLLEKKKRVPPPKVKPQQVADNKPKPTDTPPANQPKPKPAPAKVEGREVKLAQKITVRHPTVRVQVWDHQEVDGDRISLKLDEMWIMQNYTLTEKKKEVVISLKPGANFFTLHALNLGKLSPNTAAMLIIDGTQEYKIVLESTMTQSGTIEINYVP